MRVASLRLRLFSLILIPLIFMAALLGYWRFTVAQKTAEELFDRSLLSSALAISRDVAISGGDVLLPSTSEMIYDATGGQVFYHVTGPGGIYVTGYAYPPPADNPRVGDPYAPTYFEAVYRNEPVRVLQITELVTIDGVTGNATVTVWQRITERNRFAAQLAQRAAGLMGGLLLTLAFVVWFGVKWGLRPLTDLQDAIAERSPEDLSRIRRPVPTETRGIVKTLNRLFGQVETSINAHQVFISDAAHQLRNPAAAVKSMAEAVRDAKSEKDRNHRISELVSAAHSSARVADQLLSLDRLQQPMLDTAQEDFNLGKLIQEICTEAGPTVLSRCNNFELDSPEEPITVRADKMFVAEAIKNLIDNALKHGGPELSSIQVSLSEHDGMALITVSDDGRGLRPEQSEAAFGRFSQVNSSNGSGLGLAIAMSVAVRHGGSLAINQVDQGASLTLAFPCSI